MSHFGQNAKGQFWPIFIAELRKPRKIGNTYGILVKIALCDKELIVVCVKTKTSKKPTPSAKGVGFSWFLFEQKLQ